MGSAAEDMLRECGDFGPYQFVMLIAFCYINVVASIHYFSQTIILFVPEHWWVEFTVQPILNVEPKHCLLYSCLWCVILFDMSNLIFFNFCNFFILIKIGNLFSTKNKSNRCHLFVSGVITMIWRIRRLMRFAEYMQTIQIHRAHHTEAMRVRHRLTFSRHTIKMRASTATDGYTN